MAADRTERYVEGIYDRMRAVCDHPPQEEVDLRTLSLTVRDLSLTVRDLAGGLLGALREPTGVRAPAPVPDLEQGQEVELVIRVKGRITDVGTGHSRCYELELEQRNYHEGRTVYIDHDEIVAARVK